MDDEGVLIEEYKSLREEIMRKQDARLLILAFSVTAIGTVISLTLKTGSGVIRSFNYYAFALTSFCLVMLMAALIMTINYTQQIDLIAAYIRKFIEPKVNFLCWESRWMRYRESKRSNKKVGGLPLGMSKPLALYYGFLTIAVYSVSFVSGLYHHLPAIILVSVLAIGSLALSFDLYKRMTKGWKINWDLSLDQRSQ